MRQLIVLSSTQKIFNFSAQGDVLYLIILLLITFTRRRSKLFKLVERCFQVSFRFALFNTVLSKSPLEI